MKKSLGLALMLSVSLPSMGYATENSAKTIGNFQLNPDTAVASELKKEENTHQQKKMIEDNQKDKPNIIREELGKDYFVEKLLDEKEKVIASKTIKNGEIIRKELNFYYRNGELQRKIISESNGSDFYSEEYYPNGIISSQTNYINENNKIGLEKKYDSNGTLRQEIPWEVLKEDKTKPLAERRTHRHGKVLTYYPSGNLAAVFPIDIKGQTEYYDDKNQLIKKVDSNNMLDFTVADSQRECQKSVLKLSPEELIALYEDEGDISYDKCGLPYRETFVNEVTTIKSNLSQKISYDEVGMIRKMSRYWEGQKDGLERKFDAMGNLTAEINYEKGKKNGVATGYFPTKETAFEKKYDNGVVKGKLTCYFPNGEIAAEITYKDGKKSGKTELYGEQARTIMFENDKIIGRDTPKAPRQIAPSQLNKVAEINDKCVNIDDKMSTYAEKIAQNEKKITKNFKLEIPFACRDFEKYKAEPGNYSCYDSGGVLRVIVPTAYKRDKYAVAEVYTADSKLLYGIPYNQKQKQGFTRQYDKQRNLVAELFFNKDQLADTSRTFYSNGKVKDSLTLSEDNKQKLMSSFDEQGDVLFSINYNQGQKREAYVEDEKYGTYLTYYQDKLDDIREVEKTNPTNYTEYNLALGEYISYQNNEIVNGGKICGYENKSNDINKLDKGPQAEYTPEELRMVPKKETTQPVETPKENEKTKVETPSETTVSQPAPVVNTPIIPQKVEIMPIMEADEAPFVENLEEIPETANVPAKKEAPLVESQEKISEIENLPDIKIEKADTPLDKALIPTPAEKKQAELASKNIGPIAKPKIDELTDTVTKQSASVTPQSEVKNDVSKTEKFYYPNGKLRRTVTTKGNRTEEIKEYSKTGLMLTDKKYSQDEITIEKYYGSGEIRRKTIKSYDDDPIIAFRMREDFYDNGHKRYEIERQAKDILFIDKKFDAEGKLQQKTEQKGALSYVTEEYFPSGKVQKQTMREGMTFLTKTYDETGKLLQMSLNNQKLPNNMAENSAKIMKDNHKYYTKNSKLKSEFTVAHNQNMLTEYFDNGKRHSEIVYFNNGEISVKIYAPDGELDKFAYLSPDGRLHIQKPEIRTIPSYRERYWIDYNNPLWIENGDKYGVINIVRLNLDIVAYIYAELEEKVPEILQNIYKSYE